MSELTYEKAIIRLEEIVSVLENGKADLEETIALYDEGLKLAAFCNDALKTAKQKIVTIEEYIKEQSNNEE